MKIIKAIEDIPFTEEAVVSIGTFDGLHIGHKKVIGTVKERIKTKGIKSFVITFSNHPFDIIFPYKKIKRIIPLEFKTNFFYKQGIDYLIFIKFDKLFASISHESFFNTLQSRIKNMELVVGDFFKFGNENKGNISFLKQKEKKGKFRLRVVSHIYYDNELVSSSRIRELIQKGKVNIANKLLDREYFIDGVCIKGERLGTTIGFPTVNIINKELVLPCNGAYKTTIKIDSKLYKGMTFIGNKSIGNKNQDVIETNVFSFNKEIYNKKVCIFFQEKIRNEMKFASTEELRKQLVKDRAKAIDMDKELFIK